MNPKHWDNPTRFNPDRWDTEEVKNRCRCSYLPFATGPGGCIDFNALQEAKLFISMLVYRYQIIRDGNGSVEYDGDFLLVRLLDLYLRSKKRTSWLTSSRALQNT